MSGLDEWAESVARRFPPAALFSALGTETPLRSLQSRRTYCGDFFRLFQIRNASGTAQDRHTRALPFALARADP